MFAKYAMHGLPLHVLDGDLKSYKIHEKTKHRTTRNDSKNRKILPDTGEMKKGGAPPDFDLPQGQINEWNTPG